MSIRQSVDPVSQALGIYQVHISYLGVRQIVQISGLGHTNNICKNALPEHHAACRGETVTMSTLTVDAFEIIL